MGLLSAVRVPVVISAACALLLLSLWPAVADASAKPRGSAVSASRILGPSLGGTVRLRGGAAIYVPPDVMARRGRVTITRLPGGRYDMHISAPWNGQVA